MNPTKGLATGMVVETNGKELTVPFGKIILGTMFDVFANTIDRLEPLLMGERQNINQSPPLLLKKTIK